MRSGDRPQHLLRARGVAADLLLGVLLEDLNPIRLEVLDRSPKAFAEAGRQLSRQLVEHIERYAAIYGERTRPDRTPRCTLC